MLAGLELSGAAAFLLELLFKKEHPLRAVVFFQRSEDDNNGEWMLRDVDGRQWPFKHAPIRERDAFVVFDERHCRGTDMRLRQNASAVLTLGPMMVKDKLMQAAGRLRKLDTQRLLLTSMRDVHIQLEAAAASRGAAQGDVTMETVLDWTMTNTIAASRSGLHEFANNGLHYVATHSMPEQALLDERTELENLYEPASRQQDLGDLIAQSSRCRFDKDWRASAPRSVSGYVERIEEVGVRYGKGYLVTASTLDEECECECELEQEKEEEEEIVIELTRQTPALEVDWDVSAALASGLAGVKAQQPGLMLLSDAVSKHLKQTKRVSAIRWSDKTANVWITPNFMQTLAPMEDDDLSLYLRTVDALVPLGNDLIVLSDREADTLLHSEWLTSSHLRKTPLHSNVLHLSFARCDGGSVMDRRQQCTALAEAALGRVQLFNGETKFSEGQSRYAAIKALLPSPDARSAALDLPGLRGLDKYVARSDLEALCEED
jgi:hypothetical protein